jgi:hypothetical protein
MPAFAKRWRREWSKSAASQPRVFDGRADSRNRITIYDPKADGIYLSILDCGCLNASRDPPGPQPAHEVRQFFNGARGRGDRIAELQLENSRLRQLVTDLLLEKLRLEEAAKGQYPSHEGTRQAFR